MSMRAESYHTGMPHGIWALRFIYTGTSAQSCAVDIMQCTPFP